MSMPFIRTSSIAFVLVLAVAAAGCTGNVDTAASNDVEAQAVKGEAGKVGGKVKNVGPTVPTFTPSGTQGDNRGAFTMTFTGTIRDANAEKDIKNLTIVAVGDARLGGTHAITKDEENAQDEPDAFGPDAFKVWNADKNDGILQFKFRQTFPALLPAGVYAFTATAYDQAADSGASSVVNIKIESFSDITISPLPVDASGVELASKNWGAWDAAPGARNVEATNFVKLVNTGDVADARVVIDFAEAFVGSDSNFSISVANNIQFAWASGPADSKPFDMEFEYAPANADGTTTLTFSGKGHAAFVKYRIVALPDVLPIDSYGISYTVTEL